MNSTERYRKQIVRERIGEFKQDFSVLPHTLNVSKYETIEIEPPTLWNGPYCVFGSRLETDDEFEQRLRREDAGE